MKQKLMAGFDDAVVEVTGIRVTFGYGHSAVCLDDLWGVCDFTVFTDADRHSYWTALEWAHCAIFNDERISRVVLLSGVDGDVRHLADDDIAEYARMQESFAHRGVAMVDWLQFDGESYRSMAFTVDPEGAWGGIVDDARRTLAGTRCPRRSRQP